MLLTELRPHQEEAAQAAMQFDGFCLFPEQRVGKTLVALSVVDQSQPDYLLVVCPKRAIGEWERQIEEHLVFDWDCEVEIVNFEAVANTKEKRKAHRRKLKRILKTGTVLVICDEAHRIKKRGTNASTYLRSIGKICTWRLALTGTPIAQGIHDAWALFDFIMPKQAFGTYEDFKDQYLVMDTRYSRYSNKVKSTQNEEEFYEIFHKYSHRITFKESKRAMGLPVPKIRKRKVMVQLEDKTWGYYDELREELETYVSGVHVKTPLVLTLTMKLQQLAGGYLVQDERIPGQKKKRRHIIPVGKEKLRELWGLLGELGIGEDPTKKAVICCRFTHEIEAIAQMLDEDGITMQVISGRRDDWEGKFHADVVLMQIQSGVAIDLSLANNYIFYSWDFSYINYEQSKFRVISFDTKQVNYFYLMSEGTVDEDIYEAVAKKKDLATLVCDRYRRRRRRRRNV